MTALFLLTASLLLIYEVLSDVEKHFHPSDGKIGILLAALYLILYAVLMFLIISEVRGGFGEGRDGEFFEGLSG